MFGSEINSNQVNKKIPCLFNGNVIIVSCFCLIQIIVPIQIKDSCHGRHIYILLVKKKDLVFIIVNFNDLDFQTRVIMEKPSTMPDLHTQGVF